MDIKSFLITRFATFMLGGVIFTDIKTLVAFQNETSLSGPEKHALTVELLKTAGYDLANWLVNLGIELAVALLKSKLA